MHRKQQQSYMYEANKKSEAKLRGKLRRLRVNAGRDHEAFHSDFDRLKGELVASKQKHALSKAKLRANTMRNFQFHKAIDVDALTEK